MKTTRKIISVLLSILMIITSVPLMAVESFAATNGTTGDCTWTLDGTVLTISGNGKMEDYTYDKPWGKSITEVIIENGVTSIGNRTFYECTSLTSITIPDSVTSIGYDAFRDCTSLTSVTIPNSVTSIGSSAFENCTSLTSITIPDSVTSIGSYAFYGTAYYNNNSNWDNGLLYIGNCLIKAKKDVSSNVEIKQGAKVIADQVFVNCTLLTSVVIPNSVITIGDYVFGQCTSLTSITIPDSVTSIGDSTFIRCTSLTSVTIGNGVTSIGSGAFGGCTSLASITIPDSVTSIGSSAFSDCTSLTSVTIGNGVTSIDYDVFDGCNSIKTATINSTAALSAFNGNTSLTSVTIGANVTTIVSDAFENCTSLTSIIIPDSVISIENGAFYNTAYYNDESNWDNGILYIGNHLIEAKQDISGNVEIKQGTKTIAESAFSGCTSLTSVTIGSGVTNIGDYAFDGCTSLKRIDVAEGNQNYSSLDGILYNKDKTILIHCPACCEAITIPANQTDIDESILANVSLKRIDVEDGNEYYCSIDGILYNKDKTILIRYPAGRGADESCITPDSVEEIASGAFNGCKAVKELVLPKSLKAIADHVSDNPVKMDTLTVNCEITQENVGAILFPILMKFGYPSKSLTVNVYLNDFSTEVLAEFGITEKINILNDDPNYISDNGVIYNKDKTALVRYPALKNGTEVSIPDSVKYISMGAFYHCQLLENVAIPESVTSIGGLAFGDCTSLKRVYIPDTVTTIGENSFGYYLSGEKIDGFTIIGKPGSAAQTYAEENGFAFVCPESIKVSKLPDKATYFIGDAFDPTGIVVSYVNNDGSEDESNAKFTITGFDSSIAGKNTITVAYDGMTTTFDVEIKAPSIALSESSLAFDRAGATKTLTATTVPSDSKIVWKSSNENVATVENGVVTTKGAGAATITSTITVNGIEYPAECAVTVIVAQTIEIEKLPEKTSYYIGDVINTAGLKLKITYSDGSTKIVDNGFVISGFDSMTAGQKTVTVAYDGQLTTFDIEVKTPEISLSNSNVRFNAIGETATLTATTVPSDSEIVWKSSNENVATVENGVVTAKGAGTATITATITVNEIEYSAECAVSVVLLDSIAVTKLPTKTVYFIGGTLDTTGLEITAKYTDNTEKVITSDLSITGFDSSVAGKNTITVAYDGKTATFDVEIKAPSIALSEGSLAFDRAGATKTLTVTTVPSDSEIVWKSSNENVATVENGIVTAKGAGTATITATITVNEIEYSAECAVSVVLLDSIAVTKMPIKTEYFIGDTLDTTGLEITAKYTNNTEKVITSDLSITSFDSSVAGKNTITVAYDGKTATFDVEIKAPSIALSESSLAFDRAGATKTLTATAVPNNSEIVWKSSNESVATVENGIVTAKGAGTATITATITVNEIEYSAECAVDVNLPTMSFPDVRSGDWYYDAVKFNFERGYITGYSNVTFGPANNIQRQDFALILARIAGADLSAYEGQNGGFSDVQTGSYYASAVAWAKDTGVANGFSADNFGVGTFISREQICIMLCRYLNGSVLGNADTILNAYPDGGNTSPWAKESVAWAVENGIVGNAGYINPIGNAGRAEVAQIIYNMANKGMI